MRGKWERIRRKCVEQYEDAWNTVRMRAAGKGAMERMKRGMDNKVEVAGLGLGYRRGCRSRGTT